MRRDGAEKALIKKYGPDWRKRVTRPLRLWDRVDRAYHRRRFDRSMKWTPLVAGVGGVMVVNAVFAVWEVLS